MHNVLDLLAIAEDNLGLVGRHHVPNTDPGRQTWWRATRSDRWEVLSDRVIRLVGSGHHSQQFVAAAVLDAGDGAALCGQSAAAQWGVRGFTHSERRPIHVLRPPRAKRFESDLAVIHTTARSLDQSVHRLHSIATTSPLQTLLDLARSLDGHRLEAAIDRVLQRRLASAAQIHDAVDVMARSGRAGVVNLREALESRPPGYIPTESNLESRFAWVMRGSVVGEFRRQVEIGSGAQIARVDFLHRTLPLIVEVNSEEYHAALVDEVDDAVRYARLEALGFVVVPVWDSDVWHDPRSVVRLVAAGARRAERLGRSPAAA